MSLEITAPIASIVSVVLAGVAIWFPVVFYRMSTGVAKSTKDAARDIEASVEVCV